MPSKHDQHSNVEISIIPSVALLEAKGSMSYTRNRMNLSPLEAFNDHNIQITDNVILKRLFVYKTLKIENERCPELMIDCSW